MKLKYNNTLPNKNQEEIYYYNSIILNQKKRLLLIIGILKELLNAIAEICLLICYFTADDKSKCFKIFIFVLMYK